ncbi:MAG TPA: c-type cytochrome [Thermomonas sp.]|nr:c-type cytochrome [Thermomonas sp.]
MRRIAMIVLVLLAACGKTPEPVATPQPIVVEAPKGDPVEGLRVAKRAGCTGCHMDNGRGGGFDIRSPEGDRVVAPNLTQRREAYDDPGIAALLQQGRTHDGHRAFGMPIYMFQHLSNREVGDITAWLRALPPVDNPGLAVTTLTADTVRKLEDGTHPYNDDDKPDPGNVPPVERPSEPLALGRHLALSSCSECHGRDLTGWEGDTTPSLVLVNKAYTPETFARLLKTGIASNGKDTATGFMSRTARDRFAILTDAEVAALKLYLDSR